MVGGLILFIVFVVSVLGMAGSSFPSLQPRGVDPNGFTKAFAPKPPVFNTNGSSGFFGAAANFINTVSSGIQTAFQVTGALFGTFLGIVTLDIPALDGNPYLQVFRLMIIAPMVVGIFLLLYALAKSAIPTVGGDV
jgi:hypothetical protein